MDLRGKISKENDYVSRFLNGSEKLHLLQTRYFEMINV